MVRRFRFSPAFTVFLALAFAAAPRRAAAQGTPAAAPAGPPFVMTVAGLTDGGDFPLKNSAIGDMTSPAITWVDPPKGTVTFLLNMHDIDAARNKGTEDQLHWIVWNIPGTATGLPGAVPKGNPLSDGALQTSANGPGTYRPPGYPGNGPKHHYVLDLYALDAKIDVPADGEPFASRVQVLQAAQGHVLGKAVVMGLFRRPQ